MVHFTARHVWWHRRVSYLRVATAPSGDSSSKWVVSRNGETPKWMVYKGTCHRNGWFGETSVSGNHHLFHPEDCLHLSRYPLVIWHNYGKSALSTGKSTMNSHFQKLFWHNQRVMMFHGISVYFPMTFEQLLEPWLRGPACFVASTRQVTCRSHI